MSTPPTPEELRSALKALVVEACALDLDPGFIEDGEQLIAGRLDLNSLDAIEIAAAVDYAYQVRIEDVRGARAVMRSIDSLADHIATERGWVQ
ncbi:MAG: acyl carrier protein [Myxococcota bacterium]